MSKPPYFPFYAKDFMGDPLVMAMSTEAVGAYIRLLCAAWVATPPATIPADDSALSRLTALTPDRWSELRAEVLAPWQPTDDGRLEQPRLAKEYRKAAGVIKSNSRAAKKRWQSGRNADAYQPQCQSEPESESERAKARETGPDFHSQVLNRFPRERRTSPAEAEREYFALDLEARKRCAARVPEWCEFYERVLLEERKYTPGLHNWIFKRVFDEPRETWEHRVKTRKAGGGWSW